MDSADQVFNKYRQKLFNIILFIILGQYVYREARVVEIFRGMQIIDITFFIHNVLLISFVLFRQEYRDLDTNPLHWGVSIVSFFSNLFFIRQAESAIAVQVLANYINAGAILFGIITILNLGRSFGIVPAVRVIKKGGLYGIIRHPMYVSDFLFKVPVVLKYISVYNIFILALSIYFYILRARYEEEILMKYGEYRSYAEKVKYRFIPFVY
ncbi:MAG: methyltransferase family protein [Syntrophomonadaceae bacterium]